MNVPPDLMLLGKAALTGVLGFTVGWERELHGHAAGVRTIALMTMGSTVLTSIALSSFPVTDRIVANILTGVGFLGAGLILHAQNDKVHGLTSAAAIWAMTSVSIVIGLGHYVLGIGLTGFVLLLLWWQYLPWTERLTPAPTRRDMAAWRASHRDQDEHAPE